jgi:hypothetical protein
MQPLEYLSLSGMVNGKNEPNRSLLSVVIRVMYSICCPGMLRRSPKKSISTIRTTRDYSAFEWHSNVNDEPN